MRGPVGWGGKGLRALLALGMSKVRLVSVSCRLRCCKTVLGSCPTTRTVIGGLKTVKLGFQSRLYCKIWLERCILLQKLIVSLEIIKTLHKIWVNTEFCLGNWCQVTKNLNLVFKLPYKMVFTVRNKGNIVFWFINLVFLRVAFATLGKSMIIANCAS